jgi:two-component system, chemotaxis family, chemotaxis protein CheY
VQAMRTDMRFASVPVMMVTTETEMSQVMKALEMGANEYVMKPFTPEILHDKFSLLGLLPGVD